jgi:hypothetical protein
MTEAAVRALLHLWTLALVAGAAILAAVSFDTSGWDAWSARYITVFMMLASILLPVMP